MTTSHDVLSRITLDPQQCHGKPSIRGLRYSVAWPLELMSSGMTAAEILEDYEDLQEQDIYAVLMYAARLSQVKRIEVNAA